MMEPCGSKTRKKRQIAESGSSDPADDLIALTTSSAIALDDTLSPLRQNLDPHLVHCVTESMQDSLEEESVKSLGRIPTKPRGIVGPIVNDQEIPRGIFYHFMNLVIGVIILLVILIFTGPVDDWLSISFLIFGHFGLLYDNGLNVLGRYVGPSDNLRRLNKYKFVWHVVAMPLFAIPVTKLATMGLMIGANQVWVVRSLTTIAVLDGAHWVYHCQPKDLRMVDNRESETPTGMHLSGTLSYTADVFWQVVLPPVLLVLYEIVVGVQLLFRDPTGGEESTIKSIRIAGQLLLSCGVLTLVSSGMAKRYPELQLLGENLHSLLLWAAWHSAASA